MRNVNNNNNNNNNNKTVKLFQQSDFWLFACVAPFVSVPHTPDSIVKRPGQLNSQCLLTRITVDFQGCFDMFRWLKVKNNMVFDRETSPC